MDGRFDGPAIARRMMTNNVEVSGHDGVRAGTGDEACRLQDSRRSSRCRLHARRRAPTGEGETESVGRTRWASIPGAAAAAHPRLTRMGLRGGTDVAAGGGAPPPHAATMAKVTRTAAARVLIRARYKSLPADRGPGPPGRSATCGLDVLRLRGYGPSCFGDWG